MAQNKDNEIFMHLLLLNSPLMVDPGLSSFTLEFL